MSPRNLVLYCMIVGDSRITRCGEGMIILSVKTKVAINPNLTIGDRYITVANSKTLLAKSIKMIYCRARTVQNRAPFMQDSNKKSKEF